MKVQEALDEIRTKPTVPVWPHVGMVLGMSRAGTYAAVGRNEIDVIKIGRVYRAPTAPLRKRLGIEAA